MKIRYLKSATVSIETKGVKILTDPWLTDGEYYGSWYHYPKFPFKEDYFSDVDYIYISHIHPDHFSKATLKLVNKSIPVLIHSYESKFLKQNIERLGFNVIELQHNTRTHLKNGVYINILAADNCNPELCANFFGCGLVESKFGSTQIDTLSVIDDGDFCLLNTNDCPFALAKDTLKIVKDIYPKIDFLLVGYGGAGPYPQCFHLTEEEKIKGAENKKLQFLGYGLQYINEVMPKFVLPFAGTYVLGGKLASLQKYRGVPEIEEAAAYFTNHISPESKVILLNSYEYFDLEKEQPSEQYKPTDFLEKEKYVNDILSKELFDYEKEIIPIIDEIIPLLEKAYNRFETKRREISFTSQTTILVKLDEENWCSISADGKGYKIIKDVEKQKIKNFVSYEVDLRLLKNILLGPKYAHWNNAEIGSHIKFERNPNIFERGLYHAMCFFHS